MFDDPAAWARSSGVLIVLVLVLAIVAHVVARRVIPRTVVLALLRRQAVSEPLPAAEQAKRAETLGHVFLRTIDVVLVAVALLLVLGELGLNLAPLLAGAGIVGIAVGFGAQSLVRDLLAGIFVLLENQYGKGDVVRVAGVSGSVEDFGLRRTVLRDLDGIVHTIPNGEITVASNFTRGWSAVNLNVSVGYGEDLERVRAVLDRVGEELAADPEWAEVILEAPRVLRIDAFEESGIALKLLAKTVPMKQWDVAGELRRRIKAAFDAEAIEIPFPHRVMVTRSEGAAGDEAER